MFNFLTRREKGILFIFPVLMIAVIVFLWIEVSYFRGQMLIERERKQRWQNQYIALNNQIERFTEQQRALTAAVNDLRQKRALSKQDLTNALNQHQNWRDQPLPADVVRVLNHATD